MRNMKNMLIVPASKRAKSPASTIHYMGGLMTFLAEIKDTGGTFAVMELLSKGGNELPPHLHEREDEWLHILEGEIEAYVDGEAFEISSGESIFLPKLRPHAWSIKSPRLRALIVVQPAGLEQYFRAIGGPSAEGSVLPEQAITHSKDDPANSIRVGAEFGIRFLTPEKTAETLPHYSGFVATRRNLIWMDRRRKTEKTSTRVSKRFTTR